MDCVATRPGFIDKRKSRAVFGELFCQLYDSVEGVGNVPVKTHLSQSNPRCAGWTDRPSYCLNGRDLRVPLEVFLQCNPFLAPLNRVLPEIHSGCLPHIQKYFP